MRLVLLAMMFGLVVLGATSCGRLTVGDPGRTQVVLLHNATDVRVAVFGGSESLTPVPDARLEPGEVKRTGWFIPPSGTGRRTIQAYDEAGVRLFCKTYTFSYEDANRTVLEVEIVSGQFSC